MLAAKNGNGEHRDADATKGYGAECPFVTERMARNDLRDAKGNRACHKKGEEGGTKHHARDPAGKIMIKIIP